MNLDELEQARAALDAIPTPKNEEEWRKISMAFKSAGGDFAFWDEWCKRGEGYDAHANAQRWDSFKEGGITAATLFREARLNGWTRPRRKAAVYTGTIPKPPKPYTPPVKPPMTEAERSEQEKAAEAARAYIEKTLANAPAAGVYLKQRGIADAPKKGFLFGWDNEKQALVIIWPEKNYYVTRMANVPPNGGKNRYAFPPKLEKPVYNLGAFEHKTAYITEGQIDAVTLTLAGFPAAACNTPAAILDAITGKPVETVYYIADADEAGTSKAKSITEALRQAGKAAHIITLPAHDANALYLEAYEKAGGNDAAALDAVKHAITEGQAAADAQERKEREAQLANAEAQTVAAHIKRLRTLNKTPLPPISTGFPTLDRLFNGGFRAGELTVLGGVSSIGKTAFVMQIVDHAAAEGTDCIVFSTEMSEADLAARSVSRESCELCADGFIPWCFSQWDVQNEEQYHEAGRQTQLRSLDAAWKSYASYAGYITIVQNNGQNMTAEQIKNYVTQYCTVTGRKPLILVDYLQNLTPETDPAAIRANVEQAVRALKAIANELGLSVIAISALNRDNYGKPLNLAAFKESGNIEYAADKLIGLQFHAVHELDQERQQKNQPEALSLPRIAAEKQMPIRDVEVSILKQRGGRSDGYCRLDYDAEHNRFFNDDEFVLTAENSVYMGAARRARAQKDAEREAKQRGEALPPSAPAQVEPAINAFAENLAKQAAEKAKKPKKAKKD